MRLSPLGGFSSFGRGKRAMALLMNRTRKIIWTRMDDAQIEVWASARPLQRFYRKRVALLLKWFKNDHGSVFALIRVDPDGSIWLGGTRGNFMLALSLWAQVAEEVTVKCCGVPSTAAMYYSVVYCVPGEDVTYSDGFTCADHSFDDAQRYVPEGAEVLESEFHMIER